MKAETKFEKAKAIVASGKSVHDACKETGLTNAMYYYWKSKASGKVRKRNRGKALKPKLHKLELPELQTGKLFAVWGSRDEILAIARGLQ